MDDPISPVIDDDDRMRPKAHPDTSGCWILPFGYGLLLFMASVFWMSWGRFFDRGFYTAISDIPWVATEDAMPSFARLISAVTRLVGALGICASLVIMGVAATGYRRGEPWAWYILWALPLHATLDLATLAAYDALTVTSAAWHLFLLIIAVSGLLIPYRAFFGAPAPRPHEAARA